MSSWYCQLKAQKTGRGACRRVECDGCEYHEAAKAAREQIARMSGANASAKAESRRVGCVSVGRPKTREYLRQKIQQKQAHIAKEKERIAILLELLKEQEEG